MRKDITKEMSVEEFMRLSLISNALDKNDKETFNRLISENYTLISEDKE